MMNLEAFYKILQRNTFNNATESISSACDWMPESDINSSDSGPEQCAINKTPIVTEIVEQCMYAEQVAAYSLFVGAAIVVFLLFLLVALLIVIFHMKLKMTKMRRYVAEVLITCMTCA